MADTKMSALPVAGALAGADIFAIDQGGVSKQASATQIAAFTGSGSVPTARLINTTSPLAGGGDLSADRTLSIADAVADGATKGAAAFLAADFNSAAGVISIDYTSGQAASAVLKGFLTSADWSTFNSKISSARLINTTAPLAGGGDLSADRTLSIADAVADGVTKGAATFTASDFNSAAGVISIDYVNGQAASAVNKGFLTAADFVTFSASSPPFTDTNAIIKGSGDPTKLLRFEVDGFTAGSTRVLTPPNLNCTIAGLQVSQTFSADQTFTPGNNVVPVTVGGNSVTGASTTSTLAINTTWNTTGAPDAIQLIVTDTASDPASNLLDLMVGATSQFAVSKVGTVNQLGQLRITGAAALTSLIYASTNTTATGLTIFEQASADTDDYDLSFRKSRGTVAVPTVITVGDFLGNIIFRGYSGAGGYVTGASIRAVSTGTIASTRIPASLLFSTGTDATPSVLTTRLTIDNGGISTFTGRIIATDQILINTTTNQPGSYSRLDTDTITRTFLGLTSTDAPTLEFGPGGVSGRDIKLVRDTTNVLALRNGGSNQQLRLYETFTDSSNYSRSGLFPQSGNHLIRTEAAGTGTLRILQVGTGPSAGANIAGIDCIVHGGQSTGSAAGGSILLQVSAAGGAGSGVNALATVGTIASTGAVTFTGSTLSASGTAIPAGGTAGVGYKFSSTSNFGIFFGSGAPSLVSAKGSLYLRSDGSGTTDRAYIATDSAGTWTALTTVG